ncbi:MAG: hypothetical protein ACHQXG_07370 [Nitrososphaerales archaeon]
MANFTDSEITTLKNTLATVRDALKEDDSPMAQQLKNLIVDSEQIVSGKTEKDNQITPMGGSVTSDVADKTKSLFEMLHIGTC